MLGRRPVFPGNDYIHQLRLIMKLVGTPATADEMWFVHNAKARRFLASLPRYEPVALGSLFAGADERGLALLQARRRRRRGSGGGPSFWFARQGSFVWRLAHLGVGCFCAVLFCSHGNRLF